MVRNTHGVKPLPDGWLYQAQLCLQSHSKVNDILFTHTQLRRVGRILIGQQQKTQCSALLEQLGLQHIAAPIKIKNIDTNGYSNAGVCDANGEWEILYFSKQMQHAQQACDAEMSQNHKALGKHLGYPACCQKFFAQHYDSESHKDLALQLLNTDKDYMSIPWVLNPFARYFDYCALSHFVCSTHCTKSIQLAKQHIIALNALRPDYCKSLVAHLRAPVIFERKVDNPVTYFHLLYASTIVGKTIQFKTLKSTQPNALSQTLMKKRMLDFSHLSTTLKSGQHILIIPCKTTSQKA